MDDYIQNELMEFIKRIKQNRNSYVFLEPIEDIISQNPLYTEKIKHPIDLLKIEEKADKYIYNNIEEFYDDMSLMINNCLSFNILETSWANKAGRSFRDFFEGNFLKFKAKIEKKKEKAEFIGKKRVNNFEGQKSKFEGNSREVRGDNYTSSGYIEHLNVIKYDDKKINNSVEDFLNKLKPNLKENCDIIKIKKRVVECFSKGSNTVNEIVDYGKKFIKKYIISREYLNKCLMEYDRLIRELKNMQNDEAKRLEMRELTIKIDLNDTEKNKKERAEVEKLRKTLKKLIENQDIPNVYYNREMFHIDNELRDRIYRFVNGVREKFKTEK